VEPYVFPKISLSGGKHMKTALVTGGSSGLGFEITRQLLAHNFSVCMVGRSQEKLDRALKAMQPLPDNLRLLTFQADVGREDDVKKLFSFLKKEKLLPYLIFNVAGAGRFGDPSAISEEMIRTVFAGNLEGLILVSSYGIRNMTQEVGGIIVNVMSTAALTGRAQEAVYCAAKWGARGFTEALKAATKGSRIKVISVYPGGMNTSFWSEDSGLSPNVETFMNPQEVAEKIVNPVIGIDSVVVTDITLNRNRTRS
jgi:uncharacterized protein